MGRGSGNIGRTNKVEAPVPATVTGADNGLTLVGTTVELGGSLIQNTAIEIGAFDLVIRTGVGGTILLELLDTGEAYLGDRNKRASIEAFGKSVRIGDRNGAGNSTVLLIDDDIATGGRLLFTQGGNEFLDLNTFTGQFEMGDLSNSGNFTNLVISDSVSQFSVSMGGPTRLFLDALNGIYQFGPSAGGNNNFFQIDDVTQKMQTYSGGSINGLNLDMVNFLYEFGDIGGLSNGTQLRIDDVSSVFTFVIGASNVARIQTSGLTLFNSGGILLTTTNNLTNGAGVGAGTLLNAPAAGNPTKWIPINDNGTTRHVPSW